MVRGVSVGEKGRWGDGTGVRGQGSKLASLADNLLPQHNYITVTSPWLL